MRILFVSDTYYPHLNGVYFFVCRIAPLLQEKGHKVAVIVPSETIKSSLKKIDNIDVYGIPSFPVLYYPNVRLPIPVLLKSRIRNLIKNFKPDIIHIQDHFSISSAVVNVNKELGIPIMGTNHFMPENLTALVHSEKWKKRISNILWKRFSKVFNQLLLVTTPSETAANLIRPKLDVEVIAISSGIDLEKFNPCGDTLNIREKYSIPDKHILLYVGRVDPEKHIDEVLHAVALAVKKVDFYFVIVGKGLSKSALESLAKELHIADRVIFTGFVPEEDLPYLYKLSRCFIMASIAELLSLATLQAMAAGLPIIAVNAGALNELVQEDMNGYLFETGDIGAIAKCICNIITHDNNYRRMSEKSLVYILKHDIYKTIESFEKLFELIKERDFYGKEEKNNLTKFNAAYEVAG
jgi:1,2-diacylglycerol 3-alpha-glucosyltransferase